jgi:hypothetical protein
MVEADRTVTQRRMEVYVGGSHECLLLPIGGDDIDLQHKERTAIPRIGP